MGVMRWFVDWRSTLYGAVLATLVVVTVLVWYAVAGAWVSFTVMGVVWGVALTVLWWGVLRTRREQRRATPPSE